MKRHFVEKFGLMVVSPALNIGDEIQAIAARRFLPKVDYYINRESLSGFVPPVRGEVKLIMNGWYMHNPEAWPPPKSIVPLILSMHINYHDKGVLESFFSEESMAFLTSNEPVGARDIKTLEYLAKNKVNSYFSGCLTLTLERNKEQGREGYILAVDVSDEVVEYLKTISDRPIRTLHTYIYAEHSLEERMRLAELYLQIYQNAHCMITSRLHAALPALSFETPVLLLKDKTRFFDEFRFSGVIDFVRNCEVSEFLSGKSGFDVNCPKANDNSYLAYRRDLIERCKKFTGFDSSSRSGYIRKDLGSGNEDQFLGDIIIKDLEKVFEQHENNSKLKLDIANLRQNIQTQKKSTEHVGDILDDVLQSTSWKITAPVRMVGKMVGRVRNLFSS